MIVRKNSRLKTCLSLFLVVSLLPGQISASSFDLPLPDTFSVSWFKGFAQFTASSLLKTKPGKMLVAVKNYVTQSVGKNNTTMIEMQNATEFKKATPGYIESGKESGILGKKNPSKKIEVKKAEKIEKKNKEWISAQPKKDNKSAVKVLPSIQRTAVSAVLTVNPIAETTTATVHKVKAVKKQKPVAKRKVVTKKSKNTVGAQVIKDAAIAGVTGTAKPVGMCAAQYLTGNQLVDAAQIIPAAQLSIATTMVNKLHGIKEGTEVVDAIGGALITGASISTLPVAAVTAEVAAIANEVITSKGGIEKIVGDIDWFDVAAGSTKESKKENKYNAGLIKEIQKLTKNKESAELLTTVTVSALENAVMYSVLSILGVGTGGAGLVAVAGGAAAYGAGKGLINYLVCRSERAGVVAGVAESAALKHGLQIGGSLAAVDALPIIATELAVGVVQTMVHQAGGWDAVSRDLSPEIAKALKKRLGIYKKSIAYALEKLKEAAIAAAKDVDRYLEYVNCGPFPLEDDAPVIDVENRTEKKSSGWFSNWFTVDPKLDENTFAGF